MCSRFRRALQDPTLRTRWVARLDLLTIGLLTASVLIVVTGGFSARLWGVSLAARSPWRALISALLVTAVRHALQISPSLLHPLRTRLRALSAPLPDTALRGLTAETLAAFGLFAVLTIPVLWPQVTSLTSVPDLGDPLFSIWRLSWVAHQVVQDPVHLFDANIFHPERFTLAYSDAMLGPALIVAPALWLGAPTVVVYNVALLATFAASGAAMFALARTLTGSRAGALVAGAAFAFHAYRFAHYSHFELQVSFWMPLALLSLHRTLRDGRVRDGVLTGVLVAAQTYSSLYYGIFLSVGAAALTAFLWMVGRARSRTAAPLAIAAVTAMVAVAPLAGPYLHARAQVGMRDPREVQHYSAEPRDYLAPNGKSRWYSRLPGTGNAERQLFPGVAVVLLALVGLWRVRSAATFAYAGALIVAVDCSLGMNGMIYPWLYRFVPPFQGLRAPARFGTLAALHLSVLAGYGVLRLRHLAGRAGARNAITACALAAVVVDSAPTLPLQPLPLNPPAIYDALPVGPAVVLADFPFRTAPGQFWLDPSYMYYSTFHWPKLVNGNSGYVPAWYSQLEEAMKSFPSGVGLAILRSHGATHLIVHGAFLDAQRYDAVVQGLEARPDVELLARAASGGQEGRLYAISGR